MMPAPFHIPVLFGRPRALEPSNLSVFLFTASWSAAYLGASAGSELGLPLPALGLAVATAVGHGVVELGVRRAWSRPLTALTILSWLGWLLPIIGLQPLWPMVIFSLAASAGHMIPDDADSPYTTVPVGPPAIDSGGGAAQLGIAVAWLVAAMAITAIDGVELAYGTLGMSGIIIVASGPSRAPSARVRAMLLASGIAVALAVAATTLGLAYSVTRDPDAVGRSAWVTSIGLLGSGWIWWSDRILNRADVRATTARALCFVALISALALYAASPRGLVDHVSPEMLSRYAPPQLTWMLVGFVLNVCSLALIVGVRSLHDIRALRTRLRLSWPGARPLGWAVAIGLGCLASASFSEQVMRDALGAGPSSSSQTSMDLDLWSRLAMVALPAIWEELAFRGALQPRLGGLAAGSLFLATHAGANDGLGFWCAALLTIALTLVARRWGTVAAIATHATYSVGLLVVAVAGP